MTGQDISTILAAIPLPLVLIGGDERVIAANTAAGQLFGAAGAGYHYITVLRQPVLLDCVEAALKAGQRREAQFLTRDGERDVTFNAVAAPVGDGVMLSLEDISHVQAAGEMRRDFVANVSHELRTPLTALIGFIETLQGPARKDPDAQARFLEIMEREAGRMSRLIQDLLSLSRVESEERVRPTERVDVASLVTSASMTLGAVAEERGVSLTVIGADDAAEVPGDSDQLLQVFTNLMENGIKYGGGEVTVELTRQERDPMLRGPAVRVEVRDNGDGIDPLHIPRLTERFYRIDSHRSREMGGTGLGLAIVKHIVNRHRGRLRIESTRGQGSRFVVVLPS
ncbi:ATP-binding protein [Pseudoruegeria sp. HB172150]|uniref:ATP-binding protein n=1 Tax=Pseudoruegeria sp. HB172150 TaxID=2721164 RepID=UPI00155314C8|nr:ATP-binding protein [Pseudoruegeria sp. HB172150]